MSFTQVANTIIKDSILSSLYIDDKVVEPFELLTDENEKYFSVSKDLYSSFRNENKTIDFYKFKNTGEWRNETDYLFKNRDLLVLDWQLNDVKGLKQTDTLDLLQQAVETENLHFISIYTETPAKEFDDILYQIKAFFEFHYTTESSSRFTEILESIENEGIDTSFFNDLTGDFIEITLESENGAALKELKQIIQEKLGDKYPIFAQGLKTLHSDIGKACEVFGYCLNRENNNNAIAREYDLNYKFKNKKFIVIDQTVIQLTSKHNPKPADHFDFFTNALIDICGNLLTLTSLEIRNLLRAGSGFIGKDADGINEAALFYHQAQKDTFFEFIRDIWKSHVLSFVDYNSDKLGTLNESFWDEYRTAHDIDKKIEALKATTDIFHNELAKLNVYYNSLFLRKLGNDTIKFGDVFIGLDTQNKPNGNYWLNITAHCDCLEAKTNIRNNFYFMLGETKKIELALEDGDGGYNSYLRSDGDIVAIKWNNRPVILNIPKVQMDEGIVRTQDGIPRDHVLKYVGTLKENYTQRMANQSFSFAMRVGIDFATI